MKRVNQATGQFVCAQWPRFPRYPECQIVSEYVCSARTERGNLRKARAYKRRYPERTVYLYSPDDSRVEVTL